MLLLIQGGNLNTLNHEGCTPLAFGSERLLALLDLKAGTATYTPNDDRLTSLPDGLDNNYLLSRGNWKKPKEDEAAEFKFKILESPTETVRQESRIIATYTQPGSPRPDRFHQRSNSDALQLNRVPSKPALNS